MESFNPRPRAGGDMHRTPFWNEVAVSIHAPVRGATRAKATRTMCLLTFQSTPPCGGRLLGAVGQATESGFQSTPPCGGRLEIIRSAKFYFEGFNPRPRAGGDSRRVWSRSGSSWVSIHAPVRGATRGYRFTHFYLFSFNPRPRAGGDRVAQGTATYYSTFQSTPPCGGRLINGRCSY